MFVFGPSFTSPFWGESPLHQSNMSIRTALLCRLHGSNWKWASSGGVGDDVSSALQARGLSKMVFQSLRLAKDDVIFSFNAHSASSDRSVLYNTAATLSSLSSSDAAVQGSGTLVVAPRNFADNAQRIGSPLVLLPLLNASSTSSMIVATLRLLRATLYCHQSNLEAMQAGNGYKTVALLLRKKRHVLDVKVLRACFSIAIDKFSAADGEGPRRPGTNDPRQDYLFTDWDAMKHLLLNHQVWDVKNPSTVLCQLEILNSLVSSNCVNAAFNARGLYQVQIVEWAVHLMLEAISLYSDASSKWSDVTLPTVSLAAVGMDAQNDILLGCKNLLKHVLSKFLDRKKDLQLIAETAVFTTTRSGGGSRDNGGNNIKWAPQMPASSSTLSPAGLVRLYLIRLLTELVLVGIDHLNNCENGERGTSSSGNSAGAGHRKNFSALQLGDIFAFRSNNKRRLEEDAASNSGQEALAFIDFIASTLTPTWFACVLEGCDEEASASATFRLLTLLLQNSRHFATTFVASGGFSTFVISVPNFSASPCVLLPALAHLLRIPVYKLPYLPHLDPEQLIVLFDSISADAAADLKVASSDEVLCDLFSLLAECIGRNAQLASSLNLHGAQQDPELADAAKSGNFAVLRLLYHVQCSTNPHYADFRRISRSQDFLEHLIQALFACADEQDKITHAKSGLRAHADSKESTFVNLSSKIEENYIPSSVEGSQSDGISRKVSYDRKLSLDNTRFGRLDSGVNPDPRNEPDPGIRFAGAAGRDVLEFLERIILESLSVPLASSVLQSAIVAFPAHATEDQVFLYYDIILQFLNGSVPTIAASCEAPVVFDNLVECGATLLRNILEGLFTSEALHSALYYAVEILKISQSTKATRVLGVERQNRIISHAVMVAQVTSIAALRCCKIDRRDDALPRVMQIIVANIQILLMRIKVKEDRASQSKALFVDSLLNFDGAGSDRMFVTCLLAEQFDLLLDSKDPSSQCAASIVVALMKQRKPIVSEMFGLGSNLVGDDGNALGITESFISSGFNLLLQASDGGDSSGGFFAWLEKNRAQLEVTFELVREASEKVFPDKQSAGPSKFVLRHQKEKVESMAAGGKTNYSEIMFKGIERADKVQVCVVRCGVALYRE